MNFGDGNGGTAATSSFSACCAHTGDEARPLPGCRRLGRFGAQAFSQEFGAEADYVGRYLVARAGYEIDDTPTLWRRTAVNFPGNIETNHAATHPATPHRFLGLEKTVEEIQTKRAPGKLLLPDRDESPSWLKPAETDTSVQ